MYSVKLPGEHLFKSVIPDNHFSLSIMSELQSLILSVSKYYSVLLGHCAPDLLFFHAGDQPAVSDTFTGIVTSSV